MVIALIFASLLTLASCSTARGTDREQVIEHVQATVVETLPDQTEIVIPGAPAELPAELPPVTWEEPEDGDGHVMPPDDDVFVTDFEEDVPEDIPDGGTEPDAGDLPGSEEWEWIYPAPETAETLPAETGETADGISDPDIPDADVSETSDTSDAEDIVIPAARPLHEDIPKWKTLAARLVRSPLAWAGAAAVAVTVTATVILLRKRKRKRKRTDTTQRDGDAGNTGDPILDAIIAGDFSVPDGKDGRGVTG